MISFKSAGLLIKFLEQKLPPRIKEELFYETYTWENKGKRPEGKTRKHDVVILNYLRHLGFVIGVTDNADMFLYPQHYFLYWTQLSKHLEQNDTLTFEQEKYRLISINKACEMLEVTRPTIYKLINDNKIPFVEVLSQKRIQLKDLLDYIDKNKRFK
jgi:excisionase family DNA binding protein